MNIARKQRLVDIISWGRILANETTADGETIQLILHSPTAEIKAKSALIYEASYLEAIGMGMLPEDQEIQSYINVGMWNPQTDVEMAGIRKDIHSIRKGLLSLFFNKDKLERARSTLRNAEKALAKRFLQRQELLSTSADSSAMLKQQRYVVGQVAKTSDGQNYWINNNAFDEESDIDLITRLYTTFVSRYGISVSQIREIARSSPWRDLWVSIKDTKELFNTVPCDWSELQKDLVSWSHAYDIVNEAYERPSREIIEDDDLLDSWFIKQSDKIENTSAKDMLDTTGFKSTKSGRQEQFIVSDREGAKSVYSLNDPISRAKIKAKQNILSKKGKIKEQHLPESQSEMRQMAATAQIEKVKGIHRK